MYVKKKKLKKDIVTLAHIKMCPHIMNKNNNKKRQCMSNLVESTVMHPSNKY